MLRFTISNKREQQLFDHAEGPIEFGRGPKRDEVTRFFATHKVEASERTLAKAVDSIDDCIHLRATQEVDLRKWLEIQAK